MVQEEREIMKIGKNEDGKFFFNYDMECGNRMNGGFHIMVNEAYNVLCKLRLGMKYVPSDNKILIWDEMITMECGKGQVAKVISEILCRRHFKAVESQRCRGETICTFKNSIVSDSFISNNRGNYKDYIIRFILKARFGTLWNPALQSIMMKERNGSEYCQCHKGGYCNTAHILNACSYNTQGIIDTHDMVCNRLKEAIRIHRKIPNEEIFVNKAVIVNQKYEDLRYMNIDAIRRMKPDIQFWTEERTNGIVTRTFHIVEVNVPYVKFDKEQNQDTLTIRKRYKENKYGRLLSTIGKLMEIHNDEGIEYGISYQAFIVSSLGAVTNFTETALKDILGISNKNTLQLWSKRISFDAIMGSVKIWTHAKTGLFDVMNRRKEVNVKLQNLESYPKDIKERIHSWINKHGIQNGHEDEEVNREIIKENIRDDDHNATLVNERIDELFELNQNRILEEDHSEELERIASEAEDVEMGQEEEDKSDDETSLGINGNEDADTSKFRKNQGKMHIEVYNGKDSRVDGEREKKND